MTLASKEHRQACSLKSSEMDPFTSTSATRGNANFNSLSFFYCLTHKVNDDVEREEKNFLAKKITNDTSSNGHDTQRFCFSFVLLDRISLVFHQSDKNNSGYPLKSIKIHSIKQRKTITHRDCMLFDHQGRSTVSILVFCPVLLKEKKKNDEQLFMLERTRIAASRLIEIICDVVIFHLENILMKYDISKKILIHY